ncbi:MAG: hypothetical protein GF330_00690 [Candidatus Eisenbacteria bacterium]|nr:hypothetical protein [Candidatus Eisenbacteria bacterium]
MSKPTNLKHPAWALAACVAACLLTANAGADAARVSVPTPPGGGPGIRVHAPDQADPSGSRASYDDLISRAGPMPGGDPELRRDDAGGDDVLVLEVPTGYSRDLAVTENGVIFTVTWFETVDERYELAIHRSTDGGTIWEVWAEFADETPGYRYGDPALHIAEGAEDRIFLAYTLDPGVGRATELHVAWSPLDLPAGDFSADQIVYTDPESVHHPSITSDAGSFESYYVYLAFVRDSWGSDVCFCRSTNMGTGFEDAYVIGEIAPEDRGYIWPTVQYGFGAYVHVLWYLAFEYDHEYDAALRYRRVPDYGDGGLGSWENIESLTSHLNGVNEMWPAFSAAAISSDLMAVYTREVRDAGGNYWEGLGSISSDDSGESFSVETLFSDGFARISDVACQTTTDRWIVGCAESYEWGYYWALRASPDEWNGMIAMSDDHYPASEPSVALDPSRDERVAIYLGSSSRYLFDAEWRGDPGYPNYEEGFPIDLGCTPDSDPCLVDLNGDGDLEIVFTDTIGRIHVVQADGTPLPGWPVILGSPTSNSPVAVGDLTGGGFLSVVAGTADGRVYAFDADGSLKDGWPVDTGEDAPAYVALGNLGGAFLRAVVVAAGDGLDFYDWQGNWYPGAIGRGFPGRAIATEPAIGDLDGDGVSEVVLAASDGVFAFEMLTSGAEISRLFGEDVSCGVALADFDLDDDVEIVVPLSDGTVYLLDDDGSEFPGAWPVTALPSEITGVAIASILGSIEPEIVLTARDWTVTLLFDDGSVGYGYPVNNDGWLIYGDPIVGRVNGTSGDVIIGSRGWKGWAWDNFGTVIPGWPKYVGEHIRLAPAYGDIDLDGESEIAFLSETQLHLVDFGATPDHERSTWGMSRHDAERTACADCPIDYYAEANPAAPAVTRVRFAAPMPNPLLSGTTFSYAIPVRAAVELRVLDVSGRCIATVHRAEEEAGVHTVAWDGAGLPNGQYVAILRVRGPGVDQVSARKVTILK